MFPSEQGGCGGGGAKWYDTVVCNSTVSLYWQVERMDKGDIRHIKDMQRSRSERKQATHLQKGLKISVFIYISGATAVCFFRYHHGGFSGLRYWTFSMYEILIPRGFQKRNVF